MRSGVLAGALLAGLVSAAPRPQDIDFDLAEAVPNPTYTTTLSQVTYDPTAILESALPQITSQATNDTDAAPTDAAPAAKDKRSATACAPQPTGAGPVPSPDTASAFLSFASFSSAAVNAPTPSGYSQSFSNLQASNSAYGYMGYSLLQTYDPVTCANRCNAINGCMSINVFFERDPSVDPGTGSTGCTNPASTTNIKCVYWGGPVNSANAVNNGQYRNQFQVVISGSNGYTNNSIATPAGYTGPTELGNAAINAPYDQYGMDSYLGSAIFNSGPFSVQLCADACSQKSAYALAHPPTDGSPVQTCQFFNTYILYVNTTKNLQGQYCAMYSETWPAKYATNNGQYRGNDHYLIEFSMSFYNTSNPGAPSPNAAVHQASKDISYSTLQPFCSNLLGYTTPVVTSTVTATSSPLTIVSATTSPSALSVITSTPVTETTVVVATSIITVGPSPVGASKRSVAVLSTPAALTRYPTAILSSACSLQATPVTQTSVSFTTTTTTLSTSTSYTTLTLSTITSLTTTTLSSTSTSTTDVTTTTTYTSTPSPTDTLAAPTSGVIFLEGYNAGPYAAVDYYDPAPAGDSSALGVISYYASESGEIWAYTGPDQPITATANPEYPNSQTKSSVGLTLYYDPTNAMYGPAGAAGQMSLLGAVPNNGGSHGTGIPINCELYVEHGLRCLWGETGVFAKWVTCSGYPALVREDVDFTSFCSHDSYTAGPYEVSIVSQDTTPSGYS